MENQIYRLTDDDASLEFWIVDTNDLKPYKKIKELEITLNKGNDIYDFTVDLRALKSLIKYLQESLEYIEEFNKK